MASVFQNGIFRNTNVPNGTVFPEQVTIDGLYTLFLVLFKLIPHLEATGTIVTVCKAQLVFCTFSLN